MAAAEPRDGVLGAMGDTGTMPEAAAAAAFTELSQAAARAYPALNLTQDHILREDVIQCLESATGRRLTATELAAATTAFVLDTSATIGWPEFKASMLKWLQILDSSAKDTSRTPQMPIRSRARLLAAHKKGLPLRTNAIEPLTSSQEIGWGADAAAAAGVCGGGPGERRRALKATDVTAGGQGTSLATLYGAALGQVF